MYRRFTDLVLRPFMRIALLRLTQAVTQLPRPLDTPHAHASGADPDRVLLFGSGPAVGYGVLSHDLALPGQLARQISAASGRGVDIDVIADVDLVIQNSVAPLAALELWRYDSIVLSIGANNSLLLTSVPVWNRGLTAVLDHLEEYTAKGTGIYVVAIPPITSIDVNAGYLGRVAERHSHRLNAESRKLAARYADVTFVPFSPLVKADFTRYRSAATYQQWASVIAAPLIKDLNRAERGDPAHVPEHLDEMARQHALDAMAIVDSDVEERFTRIAILSTQLFGAEQTLIAFVDHDRLFIKASSAEFVRLPDRPRAGSFADFAIREPAPFVIEDTWNDPRFAQSEAVRNSRINLRFYAAYPIESPFGERIGVISVLGKEPRTWSDSETKLLRDLALMVQRELAAG
jgi:GAF domain